MIRDLDEAARHRYADEWRNIQTRFVDDPTGAVRQADGLVTRVMRDRGYAAEDFDQLAADGSVDHADAMPRRRDAHQLMLATARDQADRERATGESAADERRNVGDRATAATEPAFEDRHEVPPVAEAPMEATPPGTAVPEAAERGPSAAAPAPGSDDYEVFSRSEAERFTSRWDDLQASFVDDPKHATDNAKALVEEIMSRLRERYDALQKEFDSGSETDGVTERMRHRVRQYRSFFRTLVTVTSGDGAADE